MSLVVRKSWHLLRCLLQFPYNKGGKIHDISQALNDKIVKMVRMLKSGELGLCPFKITLTSHLFQKSLNRKIVDNCLKSHFQPTIQSSNINKIKIIRFF